MANTDAALGFQPWESKDPEKYTLNSSNSVIRIGDPLKIETAGTVDIAAAGDAHDVVGISAEYKAASAGGSILIWDDPDMLFVVQCESSQTAAAACIGDCADHVVAAGADIYSGHELDYSALVGDGNTAQFKIIKLAPIAGNAWGEHAKVIVRFNEHHYKPAGEVAV